MTFDEDFAFRKSRESYIDIDMEEQEAPRAAEIPIPIAPHVDIQREEHDTPNDAIDLTGLVEPVEPSERPRDAPPTKRRPACLRETLQEAKKHATP